MNEMQTRFSNFHFKSVKIKTLFGKNYLIRKVIGSRKTILNYILNFNMAGYK